MTTTLIKLPIMGAAKCQKRQCRQGIQFMDDRAAVAEMVRVARPGRRICLIHLVAYGREDRDEYFEILDPVRDQTWPSGNCKG